ncbi:hypothetical protein [Parapedobacter indicus]|uniref:Lipoprotein n=1 Tax=Parapedobacter indicus TaxID=1477437 RepID=A0A1I3TS93_9SPHI|nr:hypothetical protein [Parapedobacter indicus]PPK99379.1 hypothetical protein CLV26_11354 [Parapedobacter indicus]SFJ73490.1 hypothetical protein SAMN05444682_11354 [Parapedobacter indicus]
MKVNLFSLAILSLFFTFQACDKAEHLGEDVFRTTYLGPSDGCPSWPLVRFEKKDIDRLSRLIDMEFAEAYGERPIASAVNLTGNYREGQTVILKIGQFPPEQAIICLANVRWYLGVFVLEEHPD